MNNIKLSLSKPYLITSLVFVIQLMFNINCWGQTNIDNIYLYPIQKQDSAFIGEGMDWLLLKANNSQYILFGEQHGVKHIGKVITQVFNTLKTNEFNHLGLEMDEWTTKNLQENGVDKFITKYPNSVAFGYDGELQMIQQVIDTNSELLGLDQMLTAIHPLQKLSDLSSTYAETRIARGAFLKASLKMGEYLREEHFRDIEELQHEFSKNPSKETHKILDELETSMRIYTTWRAGQRGDISKGKSPEMREQMMMKKFDAWISINTNSQLPQKAILKMGGAHLMYGIGPNGIPTLGEHIRQHAENQGLNIFSIGIRNFNSETALVTTEDFGDHEILVIDTKTLRNSIVNHNIEVPHFKENKLSVNGFDAIIYFKNAEWSNQSILSKHKQGFKSNLINQLIPIAILLLTCLISFFIYTFNFFKIKEKKLRIPLLFSLLSSFCLCWLIIFQFLAIRSVISHTATIMSADKSFWLFVLLFGIATIYIFLSIKNFTKKQFSLGFRIYYLIMALAFTALSGFSYYWNIGGMLTNGA